MEALKDELQYSPTLAIQSLQRLLDIGRALGPERTRHELLPYLTSEIQQGNLNDELLYAIAEVLPQLVEFVANADDARGLLAPLADLACAEEPHVRHMAVESIKKVGGLLPAGLLAPTIVPTVINLGAQSDWFTPRVSACGMLPLAVSLSLRVEAHAAAAAAIASAPAATAPLNPVALSTSPPTMAMSLPGSVAASPGGGSARAACARLAAADADASTSAAGMPPANANGGSMSVGGSLHAYGGPVSGRTAELLALFHVLCADTTLEVRRAVAGAMGGLADALGPMSDAGAAHDLGMSFARLLGDESEHVRVAALGSSAAVTAVVPTTAPPKAAADAARPHTPPGPTSAVCAPLVAASKDKLPSVRIALAEALPGVAKASVPGAAVARELTLALVGDSELDVRIHIALQAFPLVEGLGVGFVAASLLPTLDVLVRDESVGARVDLAGVLMALARPLGAAGAASRLLPLIQLLLDDANTNVRLSVLKSFGEFMDVVGIDCAVDGEGGGLVQLVRQLGDDPNWRVRHATVLLLPSLASLMAAATFSAAFDLERLITDATSLVRIDTLKACASIAKLPSYSQRWVESDVLPVLCARHSERDYQKRAVLLEGLAELAAHTGQPALEESLLPKALDMARDKVPNLRLILCRSLQRAAPHLSAATLSDKVLPALEALENDDDMDVRGSSKEAYEVCHARAHRHSS